MTIRELLPKIGITPEMLSKQCSIIGNLDADVDTQKGYTLHLQDIRTFDAIQAVEIYPHCRWTDGLDKPVYFDWGSNGRNAAVYLKAKWTPKKPLFSSDGYNVWIT